MLGRLGILGGKRCLSQWVNTFDKYLMGSEDSVTEQHSKLVAKKGVIYNLESMLIIILYTLLLPLNNLTLFQYMT